MYSGASPRGSSSIGVVIHGFGLDDDIVETSTCGAVLRHCCNGLGIGMGEAYLGNSWHRMLCHRTLIGLPNFSVEEELTPQKVLTPDLCCSRVGALLPR